MPAKKKPVKRKPMTAAAKRKAALVRADKARGLKHEVFCQQYVLTQNATTSYQAAFSSPKRPILDTSAASNGWLLLRNTEIVQRIKELRIKGHDHLMVSFEETLQEIAGMSQFDPINMFNQDGQLLHLHEMDPVTRKMVNEIEISLGDEGDALRVAKIKYGKDKKGYLDMLMKFYNAYSEHQKAGTGVIVVQQYCAQDANL